MGCSSSKDQDIGGKPRTSIGQPRSSKAVKNLDALALTFPKLLKAFNYISKTFMSLVKEEDMKKALAQRSVQSDKMADVFNSFRPKDHPVFTMASIKEIFPELVETSTVTFRKFFVSAVTKYMLVKDSEDAEYKSYQKSLNLVQSHFILMDDDGGGSIDKKELRLALFNINPNNNEDMQDENNSLLNARMAELDMDGDGKIEVGEFIFGLVSWVGLDD